MFYFRVKFAGKSAVFQKLVFVLSYAPCCDWPFRRIGETYCLLLPRELTGLIYRTWDNWVSWKRRQNFPPSLRDIQTPFGTEALDNQEPHKNTYTYQSYCWTYLRNANFACWPAVIVNLSKACYMKCLSVTFHRSVIELVCDAPIISLHILSFTSSTQIFSQFTCCRRTGDKIDVAVAFRTQFCYFHSFLFV